LRDLRVRLPFERAKKRGPGKGERRGRPSKRKKMARRNLPYPEKKKKRGKKKKDGGGK